MTHSLYIHVPFCKKRCSYCDFNSYGKHELCIPEYVDALCKEISSVADSIPEPLEVHTIYFGGGTPSLLPIPAFERILHSIRGSFSICVENPEITVEANPGTVSLNYLRELRAMGVSRISYGVQSFQLAELLQLGRIHDPNDVFHAFEWSRRAGIENINLDLIYGLPEQSLETWMSSVRTAASLQPEHLSLYALTIEDHTPFGRWYRHGLLPAPDPDNAADMYLEAADYLQGQGYEQYEISNWSKPGRQCQHNLQYWRNRSYLGFGAGAHGYSNGYRVANVMRIKPYISRCVGSGIKRSFPGSPATVVYTHVSRMESMRETMITGLRLTREGVSTQSFYQIFECDLMDVFKKDIEDLVTAGLLEWVNEPDLILRLTKRGRLLGNLVFMRFVK